MYIDWNAQLNEHTKNRENDASIIHGFILLIKHFVYIH